MSTPEQKLQAAGHVLPAAPQPRGLYAPFCKSASGAVFVSGQVCRLQGQIQAGVCDNADDIEPARAGARVAMLNALAALQVACDGELSRVTQIVRVRGFIRATPAFTAHTAVLDAASLLLQTAFPGQAPPSRTAVGVSSLPDGAWVEIEVDALVAPSPSLKH